MEIKSINQINRLQIIRSKSKNENDERTKIKIIPNLKFLNNNKLTLRLKSQLELANAVPSVETRTQVTRFS